jgi:hypothetical protein
VSGTTDTKNAGVGVGVGRLGVGKTDANKKFTLFQRKQQSKHFLKIFNQQIPQF